MRSHNLDKHRDPQRQDAAGIELDHFRATYRDAAYYSSGRDWQDYAPAYRYGHAAFQRHRGQRFEQIERLLEQHWNEARPPSRLAWTEARGAVQDAWRQAADDFHQDSVTADVDLDKRSSS